MRSQQLEIVLQSRAFNGDPDRTYFHEVKMTWADGVVIILVVVFSIAAVVLRVRYGWGKFSIWF